LEIPAILPELRSKDLLKKIPWERLALAQRREVALKVMAVYTCVDCGKFYSGGRVDCARDLQEGDGEGDESTVKRCQPCTWDRLEGEADPHSDARRCKEHGYKFAIFKCDYCCDVAVWDCGGDHYCEPCHNTPVVKPCPGPEECPWQGEHARNGKYLANKYRIKYGCAKPVVLGCTACQLGDSKGMDDNLSNHSPYVKYWEKNLIEKKEPSAEAPKDVEIVEAAQGMPRDEDIAQTIEGKEGLGESKVHPIGQLRDDQKLTMGRDGAVGGLKKDDGVSKDSVPRVQGYYGTARARRNRSKKEKNGKKKKRVKTKMKSKKKNKARGAARRFLSLNGGGLEEQIESSGITERLGTLHAVGSERKLTLSKEQATNADPQKKQNGVVINSTPTLSPVSLCVRLSIGCPETRAEWVPDVCRWTLIFTLLLQLGTMWMLLTS
jgi:hypothetical protein